MPSYRYECQTWKLAKEEQHILEGMQLSGIRNILKFPISTPRIILYGETGKLPITYYIEKRQLSNVLHENVKLKNTSNWNCKNQLTLQSQTEYRNNIPNYMFSLLQKYDVNIWAKQTKSYCRNFVWNKINKKASNYYTNLSENLKKMDNLMFGQS